MDKNVNPSTRSYAAGSLPDGIGMPTCSVPGPPPNAVEPTWRNPRTRPPDHSQILRTAVLTWTVVLILLGGLLTSPARADVITFEDLPDIHFFSAGGQNIESSYPGFTFGSDVTGLSVSRFGGYADTAFPPHSGDVVIWSATGPVDIVFTSPQTFFGIWYSSFDPITLQAFDLGNNLLGSVPGSPNTDGTNGISSFLSFSGTGIKSVSLAGSPGLFVLDDVTTVPEPNTSVLVLFSFGCLVAYRQFRRA